ncbi:hypothetical protein ARMGADRAFT_1088400 [Armillaria gallica]|uniref:Uncharacterized protein n=1 Tax=Armillaria gallica TaxID=47427 RepID=A0A2H3CYV0_ARMGA|nr:hypothetical protein ARMGADRAFT_1088400 [Armillaria gallica]
MQRVRKRRAISGGRTVIAGDADTEVQSPNGSTSLVHHSLTYAIVPPAGKHYRKLITRTFVESSLRRPPGYKVKRDGRPVTAAAVDGRDDSFLVDRHIAGQPSLLKLPSGCAPTFLFNCIPLRTCRTTLLLAVHIPSAFSASQAPPRRFSVAFAGSDDIKMARYGRRGVVSVIPNWRDSPSAARRTDQGDIIMLARRGGPMQAIRRNLMLCIHARRVGSQRQKVSLVTRAVYQRIDYRRPTAELDVIGQYYPVMRRYSKHGSSKAPSNQDPDARYARPTQQEVPRCHPLRHVFPSDTQVWAAERLLIPRSTTSSPHPSMAVKRYIVLEEQ